MVFLVVLDLLDDLAFHWLKSFSETKVSASSSIWANKRYLSTVGMRDFTLITIKTKDDLANLSRFYRDVAEASFVVSGRAEVEPGKKISGSSACTSLSCETARVFYKRFYPAGPASVSRSAPPSSPKPYFRSHARVSYGRDIQHRDGIQRA